MWSKNQSPIPQSRPVRPQQHQHQHQQQQQIQQQSSCFPTPRPYFPPRPLSYPPPYSRLHPTPPFHPSNLLKVASSPIPETNGSKNSRDRSRDESLFVTVRDRKVRVSEAASLYALCRSWLRNGLPEENQFQYGDSVKSLPRPLPLPVLDTHSPKKEVAEEVAEEEEKDEGPVEQLSPKDILKRHVKRAKKVRARLREERLKRIARYKTRLALLLPPHVEQFRNDTAAGN